MATINGTGGNDNLFGFATKDQLNGFGGDDTLFGADGNDEIHGGDGNDLIDGYDGKDELYGGAGSDTFYLGWHTYSPDHGGERDLIGDFEAEDYIDLSNLNVTADDILIDDRHGDTSRVLVDVDGDGIYDAGIDIMGALPTSANFIL